MKHIIGTTARFAVTLSLLSGFATNAATIAIIDSGTDMKHELIAPKAWVNDLEIPDNGRDEDRNGYQDDIHGWNFAESNNQVIDYKYLGTLNDDIRKFFTVQAKAIKGTVTEEELTWMRTIVKNEEFIKRISIYGNFMHGTHVAGISAMKSDDAKILAVKLIPTEVKLPGQKIAEGADKGFVEKLVYKAIDFLAVQQMTMMEEIGYYVDGHKARVANGSFGTGYPQAKMIVETVYKQVLKKEPAPEDVEKFAKYFINALVKEGIRMPKAAPNTLFVFAAGNDGLDNDTYPTSPTNVQADNVISVAATIDYNAIAPFSNYGKTMVDVAAPGVAIRSAAPGNEYIQVSGTSQAAPFVAGVAGKILDTNPELSPLEVKKIIMGTVDKKDFLTGKVITNGIVNLGRAVRAADISRSSSVDEAIKISLNEVNDVPTSESVLKPVMVPGMILPLPSQFK
ncbi:S8 family serine peptidase [Bacteriovorax sp. Seq25_V]|uniref:S8 family serine peptidase n=1 Tax=Bacteriovorax sp. Seq25_V TaxID=1201288 RepID=UPI000389E9A0|nr:S8 family serine peptidase [Bacteriovorax sp. Seq25_V]EQC47665.1 peptidase, S8/S53 family [Bacteriovorax sp. Seq25_V]